MQVNGDGRPGVTVLKGRDGKKNLILDGRLVASGQPCATCGAPDSVSVYRAPVFLLGGLPEDVEGETTWCEQDGEIEYRMVDGRGNTYEE